MQTCRFSEDAMKNKIKNESALYYFRSTPFTEHGEFNYNGALKKEFFFKHMFSEEGKCMEYVDEIRESFNRNKHKTILLTGNQGCGKTTFVHYLEEKCTDAEFRFFDFDQDTSHPTLEEYVERLSSYLHGLLKDEDNCNANLVLYDLYERNKNKIISTINADNLVENFFNELYRTFIIREPDAISVGNFIKEINCLHFNQILSIIILWHLSEMKWKENAKPVPLVFCLDNLDVLVNQEIIEKFFKEYFLFARNIDSIINNLEDEWIQSNNIYYNRFFVFILASRQHTWARVRQHYPHHSAAIHVSTLLLDLTDAFDKRGIITKRENYIIKNLEFFGEFQDKVSSVRSILNDMDVDATRGHNIYDLFDDDYRQCILTFEDLINENAGLFLDYNFAKTYSVQSYQCAKGIIYRSLFEKFKNEHVFDNIGVLDFNQEHPLVSNARLILNYLFYKTYRTKSYVSFEQIVSDFNGIITKEDIDVALISMFKLGYESPWNELIAFYEIHTDGIDTCAGTRILITTAGREYLDYIATHFEFFSTRIVSRRTCYSALFSRESLSRYCGPEISYRFGRENVKYEYNFQEIIKTVIDLVDKCCTRMTSFYKKHFSSRYKNINDYLRSPFVYGVSGVLHGERVIHTHISYIDCFRVSILKNADDLQIDRKKVNKYLTDFVEAYIDVGVRHPDVLTSKSRDDLFPKFKKRIQDIRTSDYTDCQPINVKRNIRN